LNWTGIDATMSDGGGPKSRKVWFCRRRKSNPITKDHIMKNAPKLVLAASVFAITGTVGLASTAQAVTQHCPGKTSAINLDGDNATVDTDLAAGSTVCIKAGNVVFEGVVVGEGGLITSPNGKGISYYVCDDPYGCEDGGTTT
jgi:UDP-3-O-[3-hydroxymyristoyl] glucosamine N-acyltransferase